MNYLTVALRNLTRQKRRSILLAGAIGFGMFIIVILSSLSSGIQDSFLSNQSGLFWGHIDIAGYERDAEDRIVTRIRDDSAILPVIDKTLSGVRLIARRSTAYATLINGSYSRQQFVMGIDPDVEYRVRDLLRLESGSFDLLQSEPGIVISHDVAEALRIKQGDELLVKCRTLDGQMNVESLRIAGIIKKGTGGLTTMSTFANRRDINRLIGIPMEHYTNLAVYFQNVKNVHAKAMKLYHALKGVVPLFERTEAFIPQEDLGSKLDESDWTGNRIMITSIEENMDFITYVLTFLNAISLVVLLALSGVVLMGITNTLRMIILERRREIGTMRALGLKRKGIVSLFVMETSLIAAIGSAAGLVLGMIATLLLQIPSFEADNSSFGLFLFDGHLTLKLEASWIIAPFITITALTALVALISSLRAARLDPAKAIHDIH